jgi:hypothetical protein
MASEDVHELHVTGFDVDAGVGHVLLGTKLGPLVPLVALEIEGRPSLNAADETLWLRLEVSTARALAGELVAEADRAEQLARRQGSTSEN